MINVNHLLTRQREKRHEQCRTLADTERRIRIELITKGRCLPGGGDCKTSRNMYAEMKMFTDIARG